MSQSNESTQNSKVPAVNWEESTPLPEAEQELLLHQPQVVGLKAPGEEKLEARVIATQEGILKRNRGFLLRLGFRVVLTFGFLAILGLGIWLIIFRTNLTKKDSTQILKTGPEVVKPTPIIFRRISSAFVPKEPSVEPADLTVNWVVAEGSNLSFALLHPEEWQIEKNTDLSGLTFFYPVADSNPENFGKTVLAKLSITEVDNPQNIPLAQFLSARYNFDVNLVKENLPPGVVQIFRSENTFVAGFASAKTVFIFEGKVANPGDFENFLPIFEAITKSFKILK